MRPELVEFKLSETQYEYIFTNADLNSHLVVLPLPDELKDSDPRKIFSAKLIMTGNVIAAIVIEKKK